MKISMIGAGNVAWHVAQELEKKGHTIQEVFSRHIDTAQELCQKLNQAQAQNHLNFENSEAACFILAIKDDAFEQVIARIQLPPHILIVHTSGSQSLDMLLPLKQLGHSIGVFYPLQTFSKHKVLSFTQLPFCIEGDSQTTEAKIAELAQGLSEKVFPLSSAQRKTIHIAAVFACNFSNHLWAMAEDILQAQDIPFKILAPLLQETLDKALETSPKLAQTGPAKRKDQGIMEEHLQYLEEQHSLNAYKIYEILSESILASYT